MFSFAVNTMHHGKSGWKPSLDNFCPAREIRPSECPYPYPLARPRNPVMEAKGPSFGSFAEGPEPKSAAVKAD